ncbi:MAG: ATP-binding protein [Dehalococcoidia bacterium]
MPTSNKWDRSGQAAVSLDRFCSLSIDLLCVAGFDGYFKYVNAAWEKTLGWTVEEMTTKPWSCFVHPDDLERTVEEADQQAEHGLASISFENRYRAKDGSYHWLLWNSRPSAEHGEIYAIARDVTEQKRAELALKTRNESLEREVVERIAAANDRARGAARAEREVRRSDEQMRLLVENAPAAVALLDREMRHLLASRPCNSDDALGRASLVGRGYYDIFPEIDRRWRDIHRRCGRGAAEECSDGPCPRLGGTVACVRWEIHPWRTAGGGIIFLSEAINARKRAELELRETADDLIRINSELEAFTYSVSHDLKEPLRTLEAFSQFLLEDYGDKLDAEGKDYLTRLAQASARMKHLIEDLLTISRMGGQAEPAAPVAVDRVIADIVEGMRVTVHERNATVDVASGLPKVLGDPRRIGQIFGNLIANGIKFNRSAAPRIEIGAFVNDAGETVFFVRDNGIGIEERYHEKIFGVFQRLHRREEFEGTGAGLAIVKRAVEALGGSIRVESGPGEGSAFLFTLPVSPAQATATLSERPPGRGREARGSCAESVRSGRSEELQARADPAGRGQPRRRAHHAPRARTEPRSE